MKNTAIHESCAGRRLNGVLALLGASLLGLPIALAQGDRAAQPRMGTLMWGDDAHGQCQVPSKNDATLVQIACGSAHTLALQSDGQLIAWGLNDHGQIDVPVPPKGVIYQRVAASDHNLALRGDGSILAWGRNDFGQCIVPDLQPGLTWSAISAGGTHSSALRSDGAILCWGDNSSFQCDVPKPPLGMSYVAVSAGARHTVALRNDGHVVCWGDNSSRQCQIPAPYVDAEFVAISAGGAHTLALAASGRLVAWGANESNQCVVPERPLGRRFLEIAAGGRHSLVRLDDGSILCWGANGLGQCAPPKEIVNFEVMRIAAGAQHSAALYHYYPPASAPICLGDGSAGACPCGNEAPPGQVSGCLNSTKVGGQLLGSGHARIFEDDLTFLVDGLSPTIAIVLQGGPDATSSSGGQGGLPFGDGLHCLHGSLLRLGSLNATSGSFSFPAPGGTPISVLGKISAPGPAYYQVWYRDRRPLCHGDGANTTNGLRVLWSF